MSQTDQTQQTPEHIGLPQVDRPRPRRAEPDPLPQDASLRDRVVRALQTVFDPEIPVNIYELGLIYDIEISDNGKSVRVEMTLTTPNCPEAQTLPQYVQQAVESVEGVEHCHVAIVWEPLWHRDMMSDEAKLMLGLM